MRPKSGQKKTVDSRMSKHRPFSTRVKIVRGNRRPGSELSRTFTEPLVVVGPRPIGVHNIKPTGFLFDRRMKLHKHEWMDSEQESPLRIGKAFERCQQEGLVDRCALIKPRRATVDELCLVHSRSYVERIQRTSRSSRQALYELSESFDGVFLNQQSWNAACLAAGGVRRASQLVASGQLANALLLVRPPGHHAMWGEACGYCLFNSIALAAASLIAGPPITPLTTSTSSDSRLICSPSATRATRIGGAISCQRILILDWDVHHGQGTQYAFYDDNRVLFISIHRHEEARFWPNLPEADYNFVGNGDGQGYTINIPISKTAMCDADYLAIFHRIVMPVAYEFNPELVLVSCGFDAAVGCPEGRMCLSPAVFGHFVRCLQTLAGGKVILVLEGGYCVDSLAEGVVHCLKALLGDPLVPIKFNRSPCESYETLIDKERTYLLKVERERNYVKSVTWPEANPRLHPDLEEFARRVIYEYFPAPRPAVTSSSVLYLMPASGPLIDLSPSSDRPANQSFKVHQYVSGNSPPLAIEPSPKKRRTSTRSPARSSPSSTSKSIESDRDRNRQKSPVFGNTIGEQTCTGSGCGSIHANLTKAIQDGIRLMFANQHARVLLAASANPVPIDSIVAACSFSLSAALIKSHRKLLCQPPCGRRRRLPSGQSKSEVNRGVVDQSVKGRSDRPMKPAAPPPVKIKKSDKPTDISASPPPPPQSSPATTSDTALDQLWLTECRSSALAFVTQPSTFRLLIVDLLTETSSINSSTALDNAWRLTSLPLELVVISIPVDSHDDDSSQSSLKAKVQSAPLSTDASQSNSQPSTPRRLTSLKLPVNTVVVSGIDLLTLTSSLVLPIAYELAPDLIWINVGERLMPSDSSSSQFNLALYRILHLFVGFGSALFIAIPTSPSRTLPAFDDPVLNELCNCVLGFAPTSTTNSNCEQACIPSPESSSREVEESYSLLFQLICAHITNKIKEKILSLIHNVKQANADLWPSLAE